MEIGSNYEVENKKTHEKMWNRNSERRFKLALVDYRVNGLYSYLASWI